MTRVRPLKHRFLIHLGMRRGRTRDRIRRKTGLKATLIAGAGAKQSERTRPLPSCSRSRRVVMTYLGVYGRLKEDF